jgi:hypothetical protein
MKRTTQIGTVRRVASTRMPTRWGMFRALGFERDILNGVHRVETAVALVLGDVTAGRSAGAHPFAMLHGRDARVAAV